MVDCFYTTCQHRLFIHLIRSLISQFKQPNPTTMAMLLVLGQTLYITIILYNLYFFQLPRRKDKFARFEKYVAEG